MEPPAPLSGVPLLEDLAEVQGKRVLVRTDFNVPLRQGPGGDMEVADDFRLRTALPTLRWLREHGAVLTVCSHLGRPDGRPQPGLSMEPVRRWLQEVLPGTTLLENLRFNAGEKRNDIAFVTRLVRGMDCYVNEAFGVSHRHHASVVGPPHRLPSAAGLELATEVRAIGGLLQAPERPFVAVVGGAKVADKLGIVRALADKVDVLVIGGAMAFTFLVAMGHDVGASIVDLEHVEDCRKLLRTHPAVLLPHDVIALEPGGTVAPSDGGTGPRGAAKLTGIDLPDGWQGLDIGPETAAEITAVLAGARTVLWNGPLGAFEDERFAGGTLQVAQAVAASRAYTVVGGGDSARALDRFGLRAKVDFVSTGGGAALVLLEHGDLPALAALREAPNAPRPAPS